MLLTRLLFKDNKCSKNRPKKNIFLWNYILKWNTCPDFHPNFIIFGKLDAIERCFRETHRVSRVRRAGWSWMNSSHQGVGPAYAESSASVKKKKKTRKGNCGWNRPALISSLWAWSNQTSKRRSSLRWNHRCHLKNISVTEKKSASFQ